jgi:hypothetical protein
MRIQHLSKYLFFTLAMNNTSSAFQPTIGSVTNIQSAYHERQRQDNHQDGTCSKIQRNENETEGLPMPVLVIPQKLAQT